MSGLDDVARIQLGDGSIRIGASSLSIVSGALSGSRAVFSSGVEAVRFSGILFDASGIVVHGTVSGFRGEFASGIKGELEDPVGIRVKASGGTFIDVGAVASGAVPVPVTFYPIYFTDVYTATGSGAINSLVSHPMSKFGLQVDQSGGVTSWDVRAEGSLNGSGWQELAAHTNISPGDNGTVWTVDKPCRFVRSRAAGLVLGGGTAIKAGIVATG